MNYHKSLKRRVSFLLCLFSLTATIGASEYGVELNLHRFQRLNTPQFQTRAQDWFGIGIDRTFELAPRKRLKLNAESRYYRTDGNFIYSVAEAYWNYRDRRNELTIGRRVVDWNPGEAYWGLNNGLNGRQGLTLLGQEQEGLTGLHFNRNMGDLRFKFFMSYVFIPGLNPDTSFENGEVKSRSEWVRLPPKRTTFRDVPLSIFYKVDIPDIEDIVFKRSLGAGLDFKWGSGLISVFAIYKPENRLRANALVEGIDTDKSQVVIKAEPVVNHHVMLGAHIIQKIEEVTLLAAIDVTDPNATIGKDFDSLDPVQLRETNRVFESDDFVILPSYDRESTFRLAATTQVARARVGASFITLLSENTRGDDFFTDTVKWKNAFGLYSDLQITEEFFFAIDYKYDVSRKDEIIKTEASYTFPQGFRFLLGAELLKSPRSDSYWSVYRANDTIYGRLSAYF